MSNHILLLTRQEVVELCAANGVRKNRLVHAPEGAMPLFIKYGRNLMGEARTQQYAFDHSKNDPNAPRVPEVYEAFELKSKAGVPTKSYIVMEFVNTPTVEHWLKECPADAEYLYDLVAKAVGWLLSLPLPVDGCLGPIGGGFAQHKVFGDNIAPLAFDSVRSLQTYFNLALRLSAKKGGHVDFTSEPLAFYHSDIRPDNFLYDPNPKRLHIIDLQHVGILPKSFASYPFHTTTTTSFIRAIAARLGYERSPNIEMMCWAAGRLMMAGDYTLGLDAKGNERVKSPLEIKAKKELEEMWKRPAPRLKVRGTPDEGGSTFEETSTHPIS